MSIRMPDGTSTRPRRRSRSAMVFVTVLAVVAGVVLPTTSPARAGQGSLVSGVAWGDSNRDGLRQGGEVVQSGVTVQLLSSPGGAVIASTTTGAGGTYSFADVADGDFVVRVDAPGPFRFPATPSGDNDFGRTGQPNPGEPERGVSVPFAIVGAAQVTALDAGLQPIADLVVERLPEAEACEGFAVTGLPPFDASDGPGLDSGPGNCVVRTNDSVLQNYSVSLTGLPTGASVPNVVAQFTLSSPDGAALELVGPSANGLPAGCLGAANGANPASSRTINPDGSITVTCNLGTMSSSVAAIQFAYRFAGDTPVPAHASIEMHAYAGQGDAGMSNSVSGPVVEVTGTARWDLEKTLYPATGVGNAGPDFTILTIGGVPTEGYFVRYMFHIRDLMGGTGGSELVWPVTFTDVMPEFPGARITECRGAQGADGMAGSPWTLTCPAVSEVQGADGWTLSIRPNSGAGSDTGEGHMVMTVFVPLEEMNRAINPAWQPGDPVPTGTFDYDNRAQDTDHWALNGGALNFGDGHEPGWDGTGNNLATRTASAAAPRWDLQKNFRQGPTFSTQTINGVQVSGYTIDYDFRVLDLAGADNVGPWLDRPIAFKDRLVSHPGAILLSCRELQPNPNVESANCETGAQPADGWDISAMPNQRGFNNRRMDFIARIFIPMDAMPADPCENNVTMDLRNEAVGSDTWTIEGQPNNGTGFEPGWDGTTATGNNLDVRSVRPSPAECGILTADKQYIATETGGEYGGNPNQFRPSFAGHTLNTTVGLSASSDRISVTNLQLCDVFDVSTQFLRPGGTTTVTATGSVNPADYVIEYAVGPNAVDTQAGPFDTTPNVNLFPSDTSSLSDAAASCREDPGPWSTDPASFGADWRDRVNMIRVRPIDPTLTEVGPFSVNLWSALQVRGTYNGGPNAGEMIPHRIRLSNAGGWPTTTGWSTIVRERRFEGPQLVVDKTVTPTQYLPGNTAIWDLNVLADRTFAGMTIVDVKVIDTIPTDLHFDAACTQARLPQGVTMSYDAVTRQVTFSGGDVPIVSTGTNQWIFHPTAAGARRLQICTTVDSLAQPGDTYVNTMQATAANSTNAPTDTATIQIVGAGQMGISKTVDKAYVASGEPYTWSLDWGNTSTVLSFQAPDLIDVLPWSGDGAADALSRRDQFATDYTGSVQLTGPLAAPTYLRGGTGAVPGTWYYTTAAPAMVNHDPRDASNANPATPGGRWLTAAEVADFGAVTAVRFVSASTLPVQSRVRALIPAVSTSNDLDNLYVNRAMIFSPTFANQPLLSNEPYVQMPGFTLGDLVWMDRNGNGVFDAGETGIPGVTVQVRNASGDVVGTRVTDAAGRWSVAGLPAGTYTANIPASMFAAGGPLADYVVRTVGSSDTAAPNENADNNNTAAPDPATTGLTSTPVTMAYVYSGGELSGGNGPTGDDVAGLADELIADGFTTFTVDLALMPAPGVDIEKHTNAQDADTPTGPTVPVGGAVRWTYIVTNSGGVDLTNVTVTDDRVADSAIDCDGTGSNVIAGPLAPDATFTCVATGTAIAGQYANTGTVTGLDPTQAEVTDDDPSHYFGGTPAVDIEKATNGQDADTPTGPYVQVGSVVRWTYVVTNTGTVPLTNVTVTDDMLDAGAIDCDGTGGNVIAGPLPADASFTCVATGTADVGQYANLGTVRATGPVATDVDGNPVAGVIVDDDDPSHYFGALPAIDIEKATNGQDADQAPGVPLATGAIVEWTYVVTNTGNVPLIDVTVTDDKVAAFQIWCDGRPSNVVAGPLAPGASFTCNALGVAITGAYANTGSATGTVPGTEIAVTDDDPSHYTGTPVAAGLPATGVVLPITALVGGILVLLSGLLLVGITRRRRA